MLSTAPEIPDNVPHADMQHLLRSLEGNPFITAGAWRIVEQCELQAALGLARRKLVEIDADDGPSPRLKIRLIPLADRLTDAEADERAESEAISDPPEIKAALAGIRARNAARRAAAVGGGTQ